MINFKGCPHCKDKLNQHTFPAESWCGAKHCTACNSIIFTIYSDRMAGIQLKYRKMVINKTKDIEWYLRQYDSFRATKSRDEVYKFGIQLCKYYTEQGLINGNTN